MSALPNTVGGVVYVPAPASGSRTVLVVPRLVVVLGEGAAPAVLSRVWAEMTSTSLSIERVVQSIPLIGSERLPSFAVAAQEDDDDSLAVVVSIVARGDSIVDVHTTGSPPRRFSSQGLQPWHLASFSSVTGLRFGSADSPGAPSDRLTVSGSGLPLGFGAASAASVAWVLDEGSAVVDPSTAHHTVVSGAEADRSESEITLERVPPRRRSRHGGPTESPRASNLLPQRARPLRVRIGAQAPFELHVPVYIGRRPRGSRQLSGDQVILIEVPSPTREVSASHLHIVQRGDRVVVTDLKSTNGTAVTPPGAPRIKLSQGDSIVLPPYSRIEIGDGNVIEILPGAD